MPDGATVKEVKAVIFDEAVPPYPYGGETINFQRISIEQNPRNISPSSADELVELVHTSARQGYDVISSNHINFSQVDNGNYYYIMKLYLNPNTSIRVIRIMYSL